MYLNDVEWSTPNPCFYSSYRKKSVAVYSIRLPIKTPTTMDLISWKPSANADISYLSLIVVLERKKA